SGASVRWIEASTRSRGPRTPPRRPSRRRPSAACPGMARSGSRASLRWYLLAGGVRAFARLAAVDVDPAAGARALEHGVADQHLLVAIGKRGVARRRRGLTRGDVVVDRGERGAEGVGEALDVAAGQAGGISARRVHQRGVPDEHLVRAIAMADPQLLRRLG